MTDTNDFDHIIAKRLCMADAVLSTMDENKDVFVIIDVAEFPEVAGPTICNTEAVTPDRNVAITVRLTYDSASSF